MFAAISQGIVLRPFQDHRAPLTILPFGRHGERPAGVSSAFR